MFRKPRKELDRRQGQGQQLLFVSLVGGSPTTGVAKGALRTCLDIILSYHRGRLAALALPVDLRIIGPMFSGSEQSLTLKLSRWLGDHRCDAGRCFRALVCSGDADLIDKAKFERDAGGRGRWPNVEVRFDSTLHHRDLVMPAPLSFLRELNGEKELDKVALLIESDTEFGNLGKLSGEDLKGRAGLPSKFTVMKFPFHISQVAAAYNEGEPRDNRSTPTLVRPSSELSIPFDETGRPRDVVPALSPAMTTATNEFVVAKILETILVEDFRYIGIVATDTRDMIFLAAMIRQYCPDVQIFIPSGDLLQGHPRYVNSLSGTAVATTYPLFSMAQRWDPPYQGDHCRHLFSNQGDQGIYNAVPSLLNEEGGSLFAEHDRAYFLRLFDYGLADALGARFAERPEGQPGGGRNDPCFREAALAIIQGNPGTVEDDPPGPMAASGIIARYQAELRGRQTGGARAEDDVAWNHTWAGLRNAAMGCVDVLDPIRLARSPAEGYGDRTEHRPGDEAAEAAGTGIVPKGGNSRGWPPDTGELTPRPVSPALSQSRRRILGAWSHKVSSWERGGLGLRPDGEGRVHQPGLADGPELGHAGPNLPGEPPGVRRPARRDRAGTVPVRVRHAEPMAGADHAGAEVTRVARGRQFGSNLGSELQIGQSKSALGLPAQDPEEE
jgi:hypothetical protein